MINKILFTLTITLIMISGKVQAQNSFELQISIPGFEYARSIFDGNRNNNIAIAYATVFQDPVQADLLVNPNDNEVDNYEDYYLLYQETDESNNLDVHTCIEWEEMNFYYHGTRRVIYQIIQENYDVYGVHEGLTFYNCELIEGVGTGTDDYDPEEAYHKVRALYKTRHIMAEYDPTSIN